MRLEGWPRDLHCGPSFATPRKSAAPQHEVLLFGWPSRKKATVVFFFQILIDGLATGAIYALIAVGYSVTFTTMRVLNFGLGMWVMAGGMLTYTLFASWGWPIIATAVALAVILGLLGIVAERLTVRPFIKAGSEGWVMATLAVGLLFVNIAELVWGRNSLRVPGFVGQDALRLGAFAIYPQHL